MISALAERVPSEFEAAQSTVEGESLDTPRTTRYYMAERHSLEATLLPCVRIRTRSRRVRPKTNALQRERKSSKKDAQLEG